MIVALDLIKELLKTEILTQLFGKNIGLKRSREPEGRNIKKRAHLTSLLIFRSVRYLLLERLFGHPLDNTGKTAQRGIGLVLH
jgi:hypothetical protein